MWQNGAVAVSEVALSQGSSIAGQTAQRSSVLAALIAGIGLALVAIRVLHLVGAPVATDDVWWHLRLGEEYTAHGPWLESDPLLYTSAPGRGIHRPRPLAGIRPPALHRGRRRAASARLALRSRGQRRRPFAGPARTAGGSRRDRRLHHRARLLGLPMRGRGARSGLPGNDRLLGADGGSPASPASRPLQHPRSATALSSAAGRGRASQLASRGGERPAGSRLGEFSRGLCRRSSLSGRRALWTRGAVRTAALRGCTGTRASRERRGFRFGRALDPRGGGGARARAAGSASESTWHRAAPVLPLVCERSRALADCR